MDQPKIDTKNTKKKNNNNNKKKIENDTRDTSIRERVRERKTKKKVIGGLLPAIERNPSGEPERQSEIVKVKTLFLTKGPKAPSFGKKRN